MREEISIRMQSVSHDLLRAKRMLASAEEALRAAKEVSAAQQRRYEDERCACAQDAIWDWVLQKVKDMTLAEEHTFLAKLAEALRTKWMPGGGSISNEQERMAFLRQIGEEIFGAGIHDFCLLDGEEEMSAPSYEDTLKDRAYGLVAQHLETALKKHYGAICGVWRAEPKDASDWRHRDAREQGWRRSMLAAPVRLRFVTPSVFGVLQDAGRIKENGYEWQRFCRCAWSFKNSATADADIAKAIEAIGA